MNDLQSLSHRPDASLSRRPDKVIQLTDALEEEIALGQMLPGTPIREMAICQRYGVSRYLARRALGLLAERSVVDLVHNVGAQVKAYSPAEVVALYDVRQLLEGAAATKIPLPVSSADLDVLEEIQARYEFAIKRQDARNIYRCNQDFHIRLFSLSSNAFLVETISEYARSVHGIRFRSLLDERYLNRSSREHRQILELLQANDHESLKEACIRHILPSRDSYIDFLK